MKNIIALFFASANAASRPDVNVKFGMKHVYLTGENGVIESPEYPGYRSNLRHFWTIDIRPNEFLRFTFLDFDIENEQNCIYDYLKINDEKFCNEEDSKPSSETTTTGTSTSTTGTTTSAGQSLESQDLYVSSYVGHVEYAFKDAKIDFKTDSMFNYKGFVLKWERLSYCDFTLSDFGANLDDGEGQFFKERKRIVC